MVTKKHATKKVKKTLAKEVNLPLPVPKSTLGKALTKKRSVPLLKRIASLPLIRYFVDSWAELRKVTWPSRKESLKLTFAVIVFTAIFTAFMSIADIGISKVVERILL